MSVAECGSLTCVAADCNEDIRAASAAVGRDDPGARGKQKPLSIGDRPPSVPAPRVPPKGGFGSKGPGIGEGSPAARDGKPNAGQAM